jgi:hypothetical protein
MTIEAVNPPITINVELATLPAREAMGGEFIGWDSEVFMLSPLLFMCHSK